ncbi:WhiB family transcriptional regulator, partial [Streptomyces sp. A73]|nr:WhiB family transcriptional regulator [Streptomyces sp. A73]
GSIHTRAWRDNADLATWICRERCYVRQQCLAETLRAEQGRRADSRYGIAGGLPPAERAVLDPTLNPAPA